MVAIEKKSFAATARKSFNADIAMTHCSYGPLSFDSHDEPRVLFAALLVALRSPALGEVQDVLGKHSGP